MCSSKRYVRCLINCTLLLSLAALCLGAASPTNQMPLDLAGHSVDAFSSPARARVFLFVRTDCPVTNRYAPELRRIAAEFSSDHVQFWLVYPDPTETSGAIEKHIAAYGFPGKPLRDAHHELVARAKATVAPEAAVFDRAGALVYLGRIDDRWVDFGKARQAPTTHDLENALADVIAGKPVPVSKTRAIGCSLADVE